MFTWFLCQLFVGHFMPLTSEEDIVFVLSARSSATIVCTYNAVNMFNGNSSTMHACY
jgi:hypothetical protein